jgi:hypothetical protein
MYVYSESVVILFTVKKAKVIPVILIQLLGLVLHLH